MQFIENALAAVRAKLLDLTKRNRLLNFKESAKSIRVVDELPDEVFRILVSVEKEMLFIPTDGEGQEEADEESGLLFLETEEKSPQYEMPLPRDGEGHAAKHLDTRLQTNFSDQVLEKRCKKLYQESKTAIEETGSNLLHLAIGFLEWYDSDDSEDMCRAPLILVPVRIDKKKLNPATNCYNYTISYTSEEIETNLSLAEKIKRDYDLELPTLDADTSPEKYFLKVTETVAKRKRWRVSREIVLGLFSFSKLLMYRDLDPLRWPQNATILNNLNICKVLGGCQKDEQDSADYGEEYNSDEDGAQPLPLVLDADSSQSSVVVDAVRKQVNLVVEGPPGTGKSQTITNIIAAALHDGKSVLFVAEKKAALEVVRSRLNHLGLGDFCLELHSHKTQKGQMHKDIEYRLKKSYRDALQLDNELSDISREKQKLIAYTLLVNSTVGPNGETVYEIFWTAERLRSELVGEPPRFVVAKALTLTRADINDRVNLLCDIARLRQDLPTEAVQAWHEFTPGTLIPGDEAAVADLLDVILAVTDAYSQSLETLLPPDWPLAKSVTTLRALVPINAGYLQINHEEYAHEFGLGLLENAVAVRQLASAITRYNELVVSSAFILTALGDCAMTQVLAIVNAAKEIEEMKFSAMSPKDLGELSGKINHAVGLLQRLDKTAGEAVAYLPTRPNSIEDCKKIVVLKQLMDNMPGLVEPVHANESVRTLCNNARAACTALQSQKDELGAIFALRYVPAAAELEGIAKSLREFRGSFFAIFSSKYRELRRSTKTMLLDPTHFKAPDIIERLEKLADILQAIAAAENNDSFKSLGAQYKGLDTDWTQLEECISWAATLATTVGSSSGAGAIIRTRAEISPAITVNALDAGNIVGDLKPYSITLGLEITDSIKDVVARLAYKRERLSGVLEPLKPPTLAHKPVKEIAAAAQAFIDAQSVSDSIDADAYGFLNESFKGVDTSIGKLTKTLDWLEALNAQAGLHLSLVKWLAKDPKTACETLSKVLADNAAFWIQCDRFTNSLNGFGTLSMASIFISQQHDATIDDMVEAIRLYKKYVLHLVTWSDYRQFMTKADSLELSQVTRAIDSGQISPVDCTAYYRHAVFDNMSRELISLHPELATFTRASYEGIRERFASLDVSIMRKTCERIAHRTSARPVPHGVSHGPVRDFTELALLEKEIKKQKRHIPIRQLIQRTTAALRSIKPCFMMSPLSVAQYLDPHYKPFDIVIMDEASQLKPEDALGAIARAHQLVIVGDSNQLPPTSFFDRTDNTQDEDGDGAAIQDTESILDICLTTFNKRRLRWHYRSEHESLIAFSNNRFYDDDLIIFPSPMGKNPDYGVQHNYIEGATYLKGRNRIEAQAVVNAIVKHFKRCPKLSLGVATFNKEQSELVLDLLERQQKEQPWLDKIIRETESGEEPFFVKNLENVQGDERDVIMVSTTYGPDQSTGKVFQRFGPIAYATGWRRLNVIVTRAKKRLELFTSMRAADINLGSSPTRGTLALKEYLNYAETGLLPDYGIIGGKEPDSDFEVAVANHLNKHGYRTQAQIGVVGFFIDIGVLHPDRETEFVLGVECDGASYHTAKSVRDRDRLRQEILERKGWTIHRIWSTDWFKNRDRELERLLDAVKAAITKHYLSSSESVLKETAVTELKPAVEQQPDNADGLRQELIEYRQSNIQPVYPDLEKSILRDEIIEKLVYYMPTTKEEFYWAVPLEMREVTEGKQMQYIEDIFEIIDSYA